MAVIGNVDIGFRADTTGVSSGVADVEKKTREGLGRVRDEAGKAGKDAGKGWLDNLKKGLGEDSQFGGVFKILSGAGAVAGLGLAGRELDNLTGKAIELRDAFESGEKNGGQIADELGRSVPVLGSIYSAGRNIRDLWTGEGSIVAGIERAAKLQDAVTDAIRASAEASREWKNNTKQFVDDIERKIKGLPLDGLDRKIFDNQSSFDAENRRINKDADAQLNGKDVEDSRAAIRKLFKEQQDLQLKLGDSKDDWNWLPGDPDMDKRRLSEIDGEIKLLKGKIKERTTAIEQGRKDQLDANKRLRDESDKDDTKRDIKDKLKKERELDDQKRKESEQSIKEAVDREADYRKKMIEDVATAEEKYTVRLMKLRHDLEYGRIDKETFRRQVDKAYADMVEEKSKDPAQQLKDKAREEAKKNGERIRDEIATPGEKFAKEMNEAMAALKDGDLTTDQYRRKLKREAEALRNGNSLPKLDIQERRSSVAVYGQAEALSKGDAALLAAAEKQAAALDDIGSTLKRGPRVVIVGWR